MNNRKVKNVVAKCGADGIMPLVLVYIFYIILHGHLSPGGGFQGGVLMVAVVVLIYLGHTLEVTEKTINMGLVRGLEGIACIAYVCIATFGVAFGANFCTNIFYANGNIGDLISAGTIAWMDEAVGLNVVCGVAVLALIMVRLLNTDDRNE